MGYSPKSWTRGKALTMHTCKQAYSTETKLAIYYTILFTPMSSYLCFISIMLNFRGPEIS